MTDSHKMNKSSDSEDFAALFEQSLSARDNFEPGDKVEGIVAGITRDSVFVDISGKSEAVIDASELRKADGTLSVKSGDKITAYVLASGSSGVELTSAIGRGKVNNAILGIAKDNGVPVEGMVSAKINGGFTVMIDGIKAFCPLSQIDRKYSEKDSDYLGKKFLFAITELRSSRDCVVSRRTLLEKIQKESEETLKTTLKEGAVVKGTVSRIAEFGIFADIGGIEGLVPRSELSRSRSVLPDNFSVGDSVTVKIMTLDWTAKKHSLSIKQTEDDPWSSLTIKEGDTIKGPVVNIIKSGAFVEITAGIEGFIPVSKMSYTKRIVKPEDAVTKGSTVEVKVASIDLKERRISLELITGESNPWADASLDAAVQDAVIESVKSAGIVVRLSNGMEGFIPRGECLCDRNTELTKIFKEGQTIRCVAKDIRKDEKKCILSQKEVEKIEERENMRQYMTSSTDSENSLGSLFGSVLGDYKKKIDGQ
jgi:small subunit ribosomal protein S1